MSGSRTPAPAAPPLFAFSDIAGGYGSSTVIRGISGGVAAGRVLGITGRNGVGKSTLLKLLFGYLPAVAGRVRWHAPGGHEEDITAAPPETRAGRGMSYAPQERVVFEALTVRENLTLMRRTRDTAPFAPYFERFPVLGQRLRQQAGSLSGGERKILSFVRTLAEASALVLLDEPTEGVQQENIERMQALVAARKAAGTAFIVVEQNIGFIEAVADHVLVLDQGRAVLDAAMADTDRARILRHLAV